MLGPGGSFCILNPDQYRILIDPIEPSQATIKKQHFERRVVFSDPGVIQRNNPDLCVLPHVFRKTSAVWLKKPNLSVNLRTQYDIKPIQESAFERLALESRVPIDDVARIYGEELAKLKIGARLTDFLPIFAMRNVREILFHHILEKPVPA